MKKNELNITNLKNSIESLKECVSAYKTITDTVMKGFIEDSCVKRFEYTVETSWKIMKKYLKLKYGKTEQELTMNNIFRYMEGYGLIKSWETWKNYYENRNNTSHEYSKEKANEILKIMEPLCGDAQFLYENLSKSIED